MKKYTILPVILLCGLFIMNSVAGKANDDKDHKRVPIEVANLPEPVMESIMDKYEDYRITEAHVIMGTQHGTHHQESAEIEGVQVEGAEQTHIEGAEGAVITDNADENSFYEIKLTKEDETKTVVFTAEGDEIAEDERDRIYVIENEKK